MFQADYVPLILLRPVSQMLLEINLIQNAIHKCCSKLILDRIRSTNDT